MLNIAYIRDERIFYEPRESEKGWHYKKDAIGKWVEFGVSFGGGNIISPYKMMITSQNSSKRVPIWGGGANG